MPAPTIITLTTDFGDTDYFVGAMKGVILEINPEAKIVDICHHIKPQDILDGAYLISQTYRHFPASTVHCVVVDPGVGTSRRPLVVSTTDYYFVAPDNGVLSFIYEEAPSITTVHATATHYFRKEISQTFHGRDIFAPLAAWLTKGIHLQNFGAPISDFVRLKPPRARVEGSNRVRGAVIKIDVFGNCVTNISPQMLPGFFSPDRPPFKLRIGSTIVEQIWDAYSEAVPHNLFVIVGSSDYLEIAVNRGSAAESLKASRGVEVEVTW